MNAEEISEDRSALYIYNMLMFRATCIQQCQISIVYSLLLAEDVTGGTFPSPSSVSSMIAFSSTGCVVKLVAVFFLQMK
jgi:hypothetical protein